MGKRTQVAKKRNKEGVVVVKGGIKGGGKSGKGLVGRQALHYCMGKAYDFLQIILMSIQSRTVEHLSAPANKACPPIKHLTYSPLRYFVVISMSVI